MASALVRLLSSFLIAGSLFGIYLSQSGAPLRVHVAQGVGLFTAFVLPAQFVSFVEDIERRWTLLLGFMIPGLLIHEWLLLNAVSKYEFTYIGTVMSLVAGLVFVAMLLMLHVLIVYLAYTVVRHITQR